jgi:5-methylcytosine-specific restriction endonuclease McrBC regulatory subunit McrC
VRKGSIFLIPPRTIKTQGIVGVIEYGATRFEILPKSTPHGIPREERKLLIHLLSECTSISHLGYPAGHVGAAGSLAEWTYRAFAEALSTATQAGLPRKYEPIHSLGHNLKGRIQFAALVQRSWRQDGRIPIRSLPLSFNNPFLRTTGAICERISMLTESQETQDVLLHARSVLRRGGVQPQPIETSRSQIRQIEMYRPDPLWEPIKEFILSTLRQNAPHPLEGPETRFFTILFSMQDLFERLVRRRIRTTLARSALSLAPKERIRGILEDAAGKRIGSCTPDLLLLAGSGVPAVVGDVKWKNLSGNTAQDLLNDDLYQVNFYMGRCGVKSSVLVFPKTIAPGAGPETSYEAFNVLGSTGRVTIAVVSLYDLLRTPSDPLRLQAERTLKEALLSSAPPLNQATAGAPPAQPIGH